MFNVNATNVCITFAIIFLVRYNICNITKSNNFLLKITIIYYKITYLKYMNLKISIQTYDFFDTYKLTIKFLNMCKFANYKKIHTKNTCIDKCKEKSRK
jgi:hypothetical protein